MNKPLKENKTAQPPQLKKPTVRKKRFVKEMANPENKSATQAAVKAGYSQKNARRIASENLTKPDILEAIEKEKQIALESANLTKETALGRLAQFAFSSFDMFVDDNGNIDWKRAKKSGALKIVKTLKETTKVNGDVVREIHLHDPIRAISEIADFAGWKQKPSENDETIEKVALAFSMWLEDNPKVSQQEKILWIDRFAKGANIQSTQLAQKVGVEIQEIKGVQ